MKEVFEISARCCTNSGLYDFFGALGWDFEDEGKSSGSDRKIGASYYALRNITRGFGIFIKPYSCPANMIFDDTYNDIFPGI